MIQETYRHVTIFDMIICAKRLHGELLGHKTNPRRFTLVIVFPMYGRDYHLSRYVIFHPAEKKMDVRFLLVDDEAKFIECSFTLYAKLLHINSFMISPALSQNELVKVMLDYVLSEALSNNIEVITGEVNKYKYDLVNKEGFVLLKEILRIYKFDMESRFVEWSEKLDIKRVIKGTFKRIKTDVEVENGLSAVDAKTE